MEGELGNGSVSISTSSWPTFIVMPEVTAKLLNVPPHWYPASVIYGMFENSTLPYDAAVTPWYAQKDVPNCAMLLPVAVMMKYKALAVRAVVF